MTETIKRKQEPDILRSSIIMPERIDEHGKKAMWNLFREYYSNVSEDTFVKDLNEKDHVILLKSRADDIIRGFSTITVFRRIVHGKSVTGIFSGDTIVSRQYWRQTALQKAFLSYVIKVKLKNPLQPVYWFLISKGYRTYLLMARNFPEYWPRHDRPTPPMQAAIIDDFARLRFGSNWKPERGILHFDNPSGKLKEDVAPIDNEARALPEIRFFETMNPGHVEGDELCCIGLVNIRLWLSYMLKLARKHPLIKTTKTKRPPEKTSNK